MLQSSFIIIAPDIFFSREDSDLLALCVFVQLLSFMLILATVYLLLTIVDGHLPGGVAE